jgi:predicted RNase H-like HicB family nuclease
MKTYIFPVAIEQAGEAWHVCVPELEAKGAATWGKTQEEALRNIQEVMQMIVEEMLEDGERLPEGVRVSEQPAVAVSV